MLGLGHQHRYYLYVPATDMRKGFDGLSGLVRNKMERDPRLFAILAEAATANAGVARKHRARLQAIIKRMVEEGLGQGAFAQSDTRRAMETVFDVCHRFLQPVAVQLDRDLPRASVDTRAARVARLTLRALALGRY